MVQETTFAVPGTGAPPPEQTTDSDQQVQVEVPEPVVEEPATDAQEETPPETIETEPETWETVRERFKESEDFKTFLEKERRGAFRDGHVKGQQREAGQRNQLIEAAAQAQSMLPAVQAELKGVNAALARAVEEGQLDATTAQGIFQRYAPGFMKAGQTYDQLNKLLENEAKEVTTRGIMGGAMLAFHAMANHPSVNDDDLGRKYYERYSTEFTSYDGGKEALADFLDEVIDRIKQNALKPVEKKLSKAEAAIEKAKAEGRAAGGPDTVQKAAASGRSDNELLLDPTTPIHIVKEIRDRQKAAQ